MVLPRWFVAIGTLLLLTLSGWQAQRYFEFEQHYHAWVAASELPPSKLDGYCPDITPPDPNVFRGWSYRRITVTGRLMTDHLWFLYSPHPTRGGAGYRVLVPLHCGSTSPWLWVDMGWIDVMQRLTLTLPSTPMEISGVLLRLPPPLASWRRAVGLTYAPDRAQSLVYRLDQDWAGLTPESLPFYYLTRLLDPSVPADPSLPEPLTHFTFPPNRHGGYALTWAVLALTLVWVARRRKVTPPSNSR
jgi:cytochrome oxidase assembly protein ShyY1